MQSKTKGNRRPKLPAIHAHASVCSELAVSGWRVPASQKERYFQADVIPGPCLLLRIGACSYQVSYNVKNDCHGYSNRSKNGNDLRQKHGKNQKECVGRKHGHNSK